MPIVDVDFESGNEFLGKGQEERKKILVAPGRYPGEITRTAVVTPAADDKHTLLIWEYTITEDGPYKGEAVPYFTSLVDKKKLPDGSPDKVAKGQAVARLMEYLNRQGIPYDAQAGVIDTDAALGKRAMIEVGHFKGNATVQHVYPV